MRTLHVLAGVFLRTSGGPAQHLGNQVFEACRRYLVVRVVDQGIGVEPRIGHHAVDEVVYDGRDAVDTAEPLVKVGQILRGHWHLLLLPHSGKVDSMARFWSSLASSYGDTLRRTTSREPSASLDADGPICGQRCRFRVRWSQPVAATLYLRGKRWSVGWNGDFIKALLRQRRRSYGIAGSVGSR